jgi:hypothetical protein
VAAQRHHPVGYGIEEQHLVHGQASPHLGDGVGDPAEDAEKKEQKPQQGRARPDRAARGQARLGDERRRRRRTKAKQTDLHGQKRECKEVERMPHTATAETAGARRNRAAKPSATHSRQREREIRVGVRSE